MSFTGESTDGRDGRIAGVAVGIVADNQDPESMGRVKVRLPWRGTEEESRWARMATPMAGDDMGTYFLPEEDDEVLVAFEDGDVDYPYVLGALWNGQESPPAENEGDNDVRRIKSRSGHQITLDDADGEERVSIETSGGHEIVLDDASGSETVTVADGKGQNSIEFDAASGSLDITSSGTLTIEATSIELSGDADVTIESSGVLTLDGSLIQLN